MKRRLKVASLSILGLATAALAVIVTPGLINAQSSALQPTAWEGSKPVSVQSNEQLVDGYNWRMTDITPNPDPTPPLPVPGRTPK